jgi:hypothetical protein
MASQAAGTDGVPPPGLSGPRIDNVQAEPSQMKAPPSLNPLLTIEARWRRSMKALAQRPQPVPGASDTGDTDNVPTTTLTLRDLQSTSHVSPTYAYGELITVSELDIPGLGVSNTSFGAKASG